MKSNFINNILLIILLSYTNIIADNKLEKVSLQLHWKYQFEFAGFIIAKEKGFYRDVGLDVEFKESYRGINVQDEVLNGKSTYGIYNSNILVSYLKGKPIKLLGSFFKKSALVLLTKPNIKAPKDLIGKTVMAGKKSDFEFYFKNTFDSENIDVSKLKFTTHTFSTKEFKDGKVDAMSAFISDQPFQLKEQNVSFNIINPEDFGIYNLQLELFTSVKEVSKYPLRTQRFIQASIKGWEYALKHREEIVDIIYNKYSKRLSKANLKYEADETKRLISPNIYKIGSFDKNYLRKQIDILKDTYDIKTNNNLKDYLFEYKEINKNINLTPKEQKYLKSIDKLKVCYSRYDFPFIIKDDNSFSGISVDFLNIITKKLNIGIDIIEARTVAEKRLFLENGKCDIFGIVPTSLSMDKNIIPTRVLGEDYLVMATKIDKPFVYNFKSLKNKKIAIRKGAINIKKYIQKNYPNLEIVESYGMGLKEVCDGEVFGTISSSLGMNYSIMHNFRENIKIMGKIGDKKIKGSLGVSSNKPILLSIINKTIDTITKQQKETILQSWYNVKIDKIISQTSLGKVVYIITIMFIIIILSIILFRRKINKEVERNRQQQLLMLHQSRLAQMGEMISMIAHQWRQPLNSLSILNQTIILKYKLNKLDKEYLSYFDTNSQKQIQHMSKTIDDFRDFFKPEKELTKFSLNSTITDTIDMLKPILEKNNIDIIFNQKEELQTTGYKNELGQSILNIINNAKDILIENNIKNKKIDISLIKDKTTITIIIKDNAGGIPTDIIDKVFIPYFSTKSDKNGTGLGLYMTKIIIEEHMNGEITVSNDKDGAVFKIILKIGYNPNHIK